MSIQMIVKKQGIARYPGEEKSPFHSLPNEIVKLILQKLVVISEYQETLENLKNCEQVCKRWSHIVNEIRPEFFAAALAQDGLMREGICVPNNEEGK